MDDLKQKLEFIIMSARAILEKDSFQETARLIFDCCCEMTGAKAGYVALLNEDGDENELLFLEAGGAPCSVNPELPMPIRGLREIAYKTKKAVFDNDFMNSQWIQFLPKGHMPMNNVLFAPLNINNKTMGIIGIANKKGDFTQADADTAAIFGDLAAIALQKNRHTEMLNEKNAALQKTLDEIKTLKGIIPICMYCKKIREDQGSWKQLETYISEHSDAFFSHWICEDCEQELN